MKNDKLRIGLIGAGGVSRQFHLPAWSEVNRAEVVAVADISEANARMTAEQANIPNVFTDYRELLEMDLDAVDICTSNNAHAPAALAALQAGKHVLCEKPLATRSAEVEAMGQLADQKGKILCSMQNHRYTPESRALKQWMDAGSVGDIYHSKVTAMRRAFMPGTPGFIKKELSGGGPCMDIGIHALDHCMWSIGYPKPVRVSGTIKTNFAKGYTIPGAWGEWNRELVDVEDFTAGLIHFENGSTMTVEFAWLGHQQEDEVLKWQAYGTQAGVTWPSLEFATATGGAFVQGTIKPARAGGMIHHRANIQAFADAILNGTESPVPWTETIRVIRILEAIYQSAEQQQEIKLS